MTGTFCSIKKNHKKGVSSYDDIPLFILKRGSLYSLAFMPMPSMALPDMDADMRPLAEQTIHKLHNMTDAAFEEAQFTMTLSDTE